MTLTLLDVTREDLPLIERRLRAEHMPSLLGQTRGEQSPAS